MPARYSISIATVVMLVLLRLTIGWHFFSEGLKHHTDSHWTSEPVLRMAKGPLAPMFQAYVPDFHGFDALLRGSSVDSKALDNWADEVAKEWDRHSQRFAAHFGFDEQQQTNAQLALREYEQRLKDWVAGNRDAVTAHIHQWQRKETTHDSPSGDLPYQKKRFTDRNTQLAGEAGGWSAELKTLERKFDDALGDLVTDEQRVQHHSFPGPSRSIDRGDAVMTYGILGVGVCLLLGLFTRLASLAGAVFLASVVLMQPFWVADTVPTFNQYVEMVALLVLATTAVGRWGGVDFFLAHFLWGSSSTKGKTDVSQS